MAPPGAEPVTGEWRTSKDGKDYFWTPRKDVEAYGRPSSAGAALKGGGDGLANWKAAMAAIGVLMSKSAASDIATLINAYDGDPYYKGDDGGSESGKKRLLKAVDKACEVAGASSAASLGSEFHGIWELLNHGKTPRIIQPHLQGFVDTYMARTKAVEFIDAEILIVNDEVKRCGSADHFMRLPAGLTTPDGVTHDKPMLVLADGKTGKWDVKYPAGVYAQLATYALGYRYNQETNERLPIHPDLNRKWAVLIHFPLTMKDPDVGFYWVDLEVGLRAAKLNNAVEAMQTHFASVKGKPIKFELESA